MLFVCFSLHSATISIRCKLGGIALEQEQKQFLKRLVTEGRETAFDWIEYWWKFSSFDTWQFWVNILMLTVPLIILYFKIDRTKAFHLGFFGYSVHILFTYFDTTLVRFGLISYPYQAIPILHVNFGLDVSLIPVSFMLLYQWTLNNKKNFYLYGTLLSGFLAFIFKPILKSHNLIEWHLWANVLYLFIFYVIIIVLSKWVTNLFSYFEYRGKKIPD